VEPAFRAFTHRIEPGQIRPARQIDQHAPAGIVLGRHDRDRLARHVDAQPEQALVDIGEVPAHEVGVLVADVEVDIVEPEALDLVVDRARDDIARGQFLARVEAGHEPFALARIAGGIFRCPPSPRTASVIRKFLTSR
jgi:hypothetical protein